MLGTYLQSCRVILQHRVCAVLVLSAFPTFAWGNDLIAERPTEVEIRVDGAIATSPILYLQSASPNVEVTASFQVTWNCDVYFPSAPPDFLPTCAPARPDNLVAVMSQDASGGVTQALGQLTIAPDDIAWRNWMNDPLQTTSHATDLNINLSGPELGVVAAVDFVNGLGTKITIVLDPDDVVAEDPVPDETNEEKIGLPLIGALNGDLRFGSAVATVTDVVAINQPGSCAAGQIELVQPQISYDPGESWDVVNTSVPVLCGDPVADVDGVALNVIGTVDLGTVVGVAPDGLLYQATSVLLVGTTGTSGVVIGGELFVGLPSGLSWHAIDGSGRPVPAGASSITVSDVSGVFLASLEGVHNNQLDDGYLNIETQAWSILATGLAFNAGSGNSQFFGTISNVHYHFDMEFDSLDPRNNNAGGVVSNDRRYSQPSASNIGTSFVIDANGMQIGGLNFDAVADAYTHFPRTRAQLSETFTAVTDNAVVGPLVSGGSSYEFSVSANCGACASGAAETAWMINAFSETVAADGSIASAATSPNEASWGTYDPVAGQHLFSRAGDAGANGFFYLPGYVLENTAGLNSPDAARELLGAREMDSSALGAPAPANNHPLGSFNSRRGNFFNAGFTLGPEVLANAAGSFDVGSGSLLAGTQTQIGFGGLPNPDYQVSTNEFGTKYNLRPGGLTGVFNFTSAPQPQVYGYSFSLDRFAFAVVNNNLDKENWIDGSLYVGGKADVNFVFNNLELACNGSVDVGRIVREPCDGFGNDANCNLRMSAWQAAIDVRNFEFRDEPPFPSACSTGQRELVVEHTMDFLALESPLQMRTAWSADGETIDTKRIAGIGDQQLDRPRNASGEDDRGFPALLGRTATLKTPNNGNVAGYLQSTAKLDVPFWQSLNVDVRVANQLTDLVNDTVLREPGVDVSGNDANLDNATLAQLTTTRDDIQARYEWGATGFEFGLPVAYQPGRVTTGRYPQFLGIPQSVDLIIFDAQANTEYVDPDRTKVSFGVSAQLQPLDLDDFAVHIDPTDPRSIAKMDAFLCAQLSICVDPVSQVMDVLTTDLAGLGEVAGSGLEQLVEQGLREALLEADQLAGRPFKAAADAINILQNVPDTLAARLQSEANELVDDALAPLEGPVDQLMQDVYQQLPQLLADIDVNPAILPSVTPQLNALLAQIQTAEDAFSIATDGLNELDEQVVQIVDDLVLVVTDAATTQVNAALAAVNTLTSVMPDPLPLDTACVVPDLTDPNFDGPAVIKTVQVFAVALKDTSDVLKEVDLSPLFDALGSLAGESAEYEQDIEEYLRGLTDEANQLVAEANALFAELCNQLNDPVNNLNSALTDVNAFLTNVTATLNGLRTQLQTVQSLLEDPAGLVSNIREGVQDARGITDAVRARLQSTRELLEQTVNGVWPPLMYQFEGLNAGQIQTQFNDTMLTITGDTYRWFYAASGMQPARSFVAVMVEDLRAPIDNAILQGSIQLAQTLSASVRDLPRGSEEELRDLFIDFVMDSPAVAFVQRTVRSYTTEAVDFVTRTATDALDKVGDILGELLGDVLDDVQQLYDDTDAVLKSLPMAAGSIDGYALIQGDRLQRLHVGAEFDVSGGGDDPVLNFGGALDVESWSSNNKGLNCNVADADALLDAQITARLQGFGLGPAEASLDELKLGFTLRDQGSGPSPVNLFGGISVSTGDGLQSFTLREGALVASIGIPGTSGSGEAYIGGSFDALFDSINVDISALLGRTCNLDILTSLDPQVGEFIDISDGVFEGVYARGGVSLPLITLGCPLTLGLSADVGGWILTRPPLTIGGIIGGGSYGRVACIGAVRGQMSAFGQYKNGEITFRGEGFGAAGAGFCEPASWTTKARSRADGWCGTGDVGGTIEYDDGFEFGFDGPDAIF